MMEGEGRVPEEAVVQNEIPAETPEPDFVEGHERIEENIWRPGILDKYEDRVGAAASTKLLRRTDEVALRVLAHPKRFEKPLDNPPTENPDGSKIDPRSIPPAMKEKLRAARILAQLRNEISPDADLHHIVKTQLTHSGEVKKVDEEFVQDLVKGNLQNKTIAATDGMITNLPGYPLYVAAADCSPVGIYDPENNAIGAFHNGIYGLCRKITENGVAAMAKEYGSKPENLVVTIAPGISQDKYIIDDGLLGMVRENLGDTVDAYAKPAPDQPGMYLFDVQGAIVERLKAIGVKPKNIETSQYHTDKDNALFPSERVEGRGEARDNYGFMIALK